MEKNAADLKFLFASVLSRLDSQHVTACKLSKLCNWDRLGGLGTNTFQESLPLLCYR